MKQRQKMVNFDSRRKRGIIVHRVYEIVYTFGLFSASIFRNIANYSQCVIKEEFPMEIQTENTNKISPILFTNSFHANGIFGMLRVEPFCDVSISHAYCNPEIIRERWSEVIAVESNDPGEI